MGGRPHPALGRIRTAVRSALAELPDHTPTSVACSGGADSLALAAAVAHEARDGRLATSAVVVDHSLQAGSAEVAAQAAEQVGRLGIEDVDIRRVRVEQGLGIGPEAAARRARYAAYADHAAERSVEGLRPVVLVAHTRNDQAEQVLLGLARGSGVRSLAGMPAASVVPGTDVRILRPLLGIARAATLAACQADGLRPWHDPHNDDPAYLRVRARRLLPALEADLGPGVTDALARTATQARDDADFLDACAATAYDGCRVDGNEAVTLDVGAIFGLAPALATRVLRRAALDAGALATDLSAEHVHEMRRLVVDYTGQGPIPLPGHVAARRRGQHLSVAPTANA